jgi:hypothetical protein
MKTSQRTILVLCLSFIAAVASAASADRIPLTVQFLNETIVIGGATRGGNVVVFGVAREMSDGRPPVPRLVRRVEVLTDDDRDGVVHLELGKPVPHVAMWTFVDLSTGASAALPSPGYEPARLDLTEQLLKQDNAGQLKKLDLPFAEIDMLLVRPGTGIWRLNTGKYSQVDESKHPEKPMRLDVESMLPVGNSPSAPHNFKPGDVLAIIDPRWMQYGLLEVGK